MLSERGYCALGGALGYTKLETQSIRLASKNLGLYDLMLAKRLWT